MDSKSMGNKMVKVSALRIDKSIANIKVRKKREILLINQYYLDESIGKSTKKGEIWLNLD